jgi:hypothetical protein
MFLCTGACSESNPAVQVYCSINDDGSSFRLDNSLEVETYGTPFYTSDKLIFHLGERLVRRELGSPGIELTPAGSHITDTQHLAIDKLNMMLYFAMGYAICRVDMNGNNFSRLSPDDGSYYSAPELSTNFNYLTAIKHGQIARMDIQTGIWTELPEPVSAFYAVYIEDTDEYYFYSSTGPFDPKYALCKMNAQRDSSLIFEIPRDNYYEMPNARISKDLRYFALQGKREPYDHVSYSGNVITQRYPSVLMVYDRQNDEIFSIEDCYSYAFTQNLGTLLYSREKHGMADLMRMSLPSREIETIWDGYYHYDTFSYCVSEIYPRFDGRIIHMKAWQHYWKPKT